MKLHTAADEHFPVPAGCAFAGTAAGIKKSGNFDLSYAEFPATACAAALFTRNRVVAAPVLVGREHLKASHGRIRALLVNSGNANCATGRSGLLLASRICAAAARLAQVSPLQVFPSSTGIIGVPLPEEKILAALPGLISAKSSTEQAARRFAQAILTTDTHPKIAATRLRAAGRELSLLGVAKGSGMIHPQLATMLVYLFTDLRATPLQLRTLLSVACDDTFNCISVDGDTSTNDTVLLVATGASGCDIRHRALRRAFETALHGVCGALCEQIVDDGEGAKHRIVLHIEQARDRAEARRVARAIANSPLVKTAWAGADPNWGRILAAIGNSGVPVDPARINIRLGPYRVCRGGVAGRFDEQAAHEYLLQAAYEIRVQLGRGRASLRFLSCDLTTEYVHINADYST